MERNNKIKVRKKKKDWFKGEKERVSFGLGLCGL